MWEKQLIFMWEKPDFSILLCKQPCVRCTLVMYRHIIQSQLSELFSLKQMLSAHFYSRVGRTMKEPMLSHFHHYEKLPSSGLPPCTPCVFRYIQLFYVLLTTCYFFIFYLFSFVTSHMTVHWILRCFRAEL